MTVTVLWGPPLSGKSTYITEHAKRGDVVIDMDRIVAAMTVDSPSHYEMPAPMRDPVFAARKAAVDAVFADAGSPDLTAFVIDSGADEARLKEWESVGAKVVRLVMSREDALAEAKRVRPQSVPQVEAWFAKHSQDLVGAWDVADLRHLPGKHDQSSHGGGGSAVGGVGADFTERDIANYIGDMVGSGVVRGPGDFTDDDRIAAKQSAAHHIAGAMKSSNEDMLAEAMDDEMPHRGDEAVALKKQPDDTEWHNVFIVAPLAHGGLDVQSAYNVLDTEDFKTRSDMAAAADEYGYLTDSVGTRWAIAGTAGAAGLARESMAGYLVDQWAATSNDSSARSHAIQEAARVEFGLKGAADWKPATDQQQEAIDDGRGYYNHHGSVYRDFLRAQYDTTQQTFNDAGITHIPLYRGIQPGAETLPPTGRNVTAQTRPLSSWSYSKTAAALFARQTGSLVRAVVPTSRILSQGVTGVGCLAEGEMVVLGGSVGHAAVTKQDHGQW
jgi:hypothetical protein